MRTDKKIIHCVGAGSIGSFTDLLLAVIARNLNLELALYDFDIIERGNLVNQLYWKPDLGRRKKKVLKVAALKKIIRRFSDTLVYASRKKVGGKTPLSGIVVVMVDSLAARREIFRAVKFNTGVSLYIDARSGGKHATVFTLNPLDIDQVRIYEKTLEGQAAPPPCADPNTMPILSLIAGVIGQLILLYKDERPLHLSRTLINIDKLPIVDSGTV